MKPIDDYMNDPDVLKMLEYLREIHAARRMLQDKTRGHDPGGARGIGAASSCAFVFTY
jgi:hypothetical protein